MASSTLAETHAARSVAAGAAISIAVIHFFTAQAHFAQALYLGALFVAGSFALACAAAELVQRTPAAWAWATGILVSGGMFVGYLLSRTIGLPVSGAAPFTPIGVTSLALEAIFVVAAAAALGTAARQPQETRREHAA